MNEQEALAALLAEHGEIWGDTAMHGWECGCGHWPEGELRRTEAEYRAHVAEEILRTGWGKVDAAKAEALLEAADLVAAERQAEHDRLGPECDVPGLLGNWIGGFTEAVKLLRDLAGRIDPT